VPEEREDLFSNSGPPADVSLARGGWKLPLSRRSVATTEAELCTHSNELARRVLTHRAEGLEF
jgi:hypothetical protein